MGWQHTSCSEEEEEELQVLKEEDEKRDRGRKEEEERMRAREAERERQRKEAARLNLEIREARVRAAGKTPTRSASAAYDLYAARIQQHMLTKAQGEALQDAVKRQDVAEVVDIVLNHLRIANPLTQELTRCHRCGQYGHVMGICGTGYDIRKTGSPE